MLIGHKQYFIKERVGVLKLVDHYDIFSPDTGEQLGYAKETPPGWAKFLRLFVAKFFLPTTISTFEQGRDTPVFSIRRGFTFLRPKIFVVGGDGAQLGYFKGKLLSLGGGFFVYDMQDQLLAEIKGDWKGWNFKFLSKDGSELGIATKKWAGLAKEMFTSADQYLVSLNESAPKSETSAILLLAAALAIDSVLKERQ